MASDETDDLLVPKPNYFGFVKEDVGVEPHRDPHN
jgi:hypothetical protein